MLVFEPGSLLPEPCFLFVLPRGPGLQWGELWSVTFWDLHWHLQLSSGSGGESTHSPWGPQQGDVLASATMVPLPPPQPLLQPDSHINRRSPRWACQLSGQAVTASPGGASWADSSSALEARLPLLPGATDQ